MLREAPAENWENMNKIFTEELSRIVILIASYLMFTYTFHKQKQPFTVVQQKLVLKNFA